MFVNLPPSICSGPNIHKEAERLGEIMADVCTKKFLPPNELEYEKTYLPILLKGESAILCCVYDDDHSNTDVGKKRYAGYKHEPGLAPKLDVKGECLYCVLYCAR